MPNLLDWTPSKHLHSETWQTSAWLLAANSSISGMSWFPSSSYLKKLTAAKTQHTICSIQHLKRTLTSLSSYLKSLQCYLLRLKGVYKIPQASWCILSYASPKTKGIFITETWKSFLCNSTTTGKKGAPSPSLWEQKSYFSKLQWPCRVPLPRFDYLSNCYSPSMIYHFQLCASAWVRTDPSPLSQSSSHWRKLFLLTWTSACADNLDQQPQQDNPPYVNNNFSSKTVEFKEQWNSIFKEIKVLQEKSLNPDVCTNKNNFLKRSWMEQLTTFK